MLFNSAIFLFAFLPVTYLVFWSLKSKDARYVWLAITGYVFYGYWNPAFCLLMAFSTVVSYTAGLGFLKYGDDPKRRKWLLIIPVTVDLLLLGWFKYVNFGIGIANSFLGWAGAEQLRHLNIILPVGISFYTFHTITYIVDSYRRVITPTRNIFEFAAYVSLFSQLVAGPIVRFRELQEDLDGIDTKDRTEGLDAAWSFFILGMVQKVLLADTVAAIIDPALKDTAALSTAGAWLCMLGYTYQLYFDFAGYSNMAVGLGLMFGMHIPQNFNSPYKALNPSDFWRRWHISLSRCLRDYLYIALGGNRGGESKTYRNLMITMVLGGLWHGAAWTFVIWGAYHGLLLALYRRFSSYWDPLPPLLQRVGMFFLVIVGWTVFRAENMSHAFALLGRMLTPHTGIEPVGAPLLLAAVALCASFAHFGPNSFQMQHRWQPAAAWSLAALFVGCIIRIYGGEKSPFLYFQF
ncbi:MAG TPA: MBOAT family protein [Bryobacteraceae bacterium]|nr:MBOAT family protein [Bryobacteraceae bacterium]